MNERAVIYCRVSTEDEIQLNALEQQIIEAKNAVYNQGWILIDQYIDEGKSGTATQKRDSYKRLFEDLETNKFDILVIKSQDRLMRSTKDWYIFIDKLVQNRKKLFFYLENRFYSPDDALLTGIKAILAEEFSRDLSKKINNAHRNRQKNKGNVLITSRTWGYDKVGKEVIVNQKEAEIVQVMFQMCADGYGTRTIAKNLTNLGCFSRSNKPFNDSTIRRIIRNPLFKGTYVMNQRHFDFNTKQTTRNDETEWIYKEDAVPPIVDEELWEKANAEMDRKTKINHSAENMKKKQGIKIGGHPLSSKIICGNCGSVFWRTRYKRASGEQVISWCCCEYVRNGRKTPDPYRTSKSLKVETKDRGCDNIHINNKDLEACLSEIANQFYQNKDQLLSKAISILKEVLQGADTSKIDSLKIELEELNEKRSKLLDKYLEDTITETVYKKKDVELENQIHQLELSIQAEEQKQYEYQSIDDRMQLLQKEIEKIINGELALHFIYDHIITIQVFEEELKIQYDIFPPTTVEIKKINYRKTIFSVCANS